MTPDELAALRKPFPREQIGQLPKGGQMLDFVGHADVTDRLLEVDPGWTWEPMGRTAEGLPALDSFGNLWINLTICGDTKPGVGDGKSQKECVGDAIRNAAMRFGVALDLWAKGDRNFGLAGHDAPAAPQTGPTLKEQVLTAARGSFTSQETFYADFKEQTGHDFPSAPQTALSEYLAHLAPFTPEDSPAGPAEQDPSAAPTRQGTQTADGAQTPKGEGGRPADAASSPPPTAAVGTDYALIIRNRVVDDAPTKPANGRKAFLARQLIAAGQHGVADSLVADESDGYVPLKDLIQTALKAAA